MIRPAAIGLLATVTAAQAGDPLSADNLIMLLSRLGVAGVLGIVCWWQQKALISKDKYIEQLYTANADNLKNVVAGNIRVMERVANAVERLEKKG